MRAQPDKPRRPGNHEKPVSSAIVVGAIVVGLVIRALFRDFESGDYSTFLSGWYDFIAENGFSAHGHAFSNYSPPYLYLLTIATYIPIPKLYSIKLISVIFDLAPAYLAYLIVRSRYTTGFAPALAYAIAFLAPTVMINSAFWGQCDAIYTTFLLGTVYFLIRKRPAVAVVFFSIAFAFKLQAIFLTPVLVASWFKKEIPLSYLLIIPAVYLAAIVPSWIAGRPFWDLVFLYAEQAGTYRALSCNAPSAFQFLGNISYGPAEIGLTVPACILAAVLGFHLLRAAGKRLEGMDRAGRIALIALLAVPFLMFLRPFVDLALILARQPNTYAILVTQMPGAREWFMESSTTFVGALGLPVALVLGATLCYLGWRGRENLIGNSEMVVRLSLLSTLLVPFLLVRMHERCFYPADVLAVIYALYFPKRNYVPILVIGASFLSYASYFLGRALVPMPYLATVMAGVLILVVLDLIDSFNS